MRLAMLTSTLALIASATACGQGIPPHDELQRLWGLGASPSEDDAAAFFRHFGGEGRHVDARLRALARLNSHPSPTTLGVLLERSLVGVAPDAETERTFAPGIWPRLRETRPQEGLLQAALRKARQAKDPWLELNVLRAIHAWEGPGELVTSARKGKPLSRAAAIEALGLDADPELLGPLLVELLGDTLDSKPDYERVLAGACASAWLAARQRSPGGLPAVRVALQRYAAEAGGLVANLVARTLAVPRRDPERSRLSARTSSDELGYARGSDGWWRQLEREDAPGQRPADDVDRTRVRPIQFGGATSIAERVVFVLDLSDSMLNPLTADQLEALGALSRSGTIPRDRVRTRLDAARYLLSEALGNLDRRVRFAVIGYGDAAQPFATTPKLVQASSKRVKATLRELASLRPGPPAAGFTLGTLRGQTNLREAVHLAFRLTTGRPVPAGSEHVAGFRDGAQAVFVFSDGLPNVFPQLEHGRWPNARHEAYTTRVIEGRPVKRGKGKAVRVNPETGERVEEDVDTWGYEGDGTVREVEVPAQVLPFAAPTDDPYVTRAAEDHARLNAFRHVEIHASLLLGSEGYAALGSGGLGYCHDLVRTGSGELRYLPAREAPRGAGFGWSR